MSRVKFGRWALVAAVVVVIGLVGAVVLQPRKQEVTAPPAPSAPQTTSKPEPLPARPAQIETSLIGGQQPYTYSDADRGVEVDLADFDGARNLSGAMRVVTQWELRNGQGRGARLSWTATAASPTVAGIVIDVASSAPESSPSPTPTEPSAPADRPAASSSPDPTSSPDPSRAEPEPPAVHPVVLWYDAGRQHASTSPALIADEHWKPFVEAVLDHLRSTGELDGAAADSLGQRLGHDPAPMGDGPALRFSAEGDLVLDLGAGTTYAVPAPTVEPHLSDLGLRAREASMNPSAITFDAPGVKPTPGDGEGAANSASPTASPGAATTPTAPQGSAGPGTARPTPSGEKRPSAAVGTDCQRVKCIALTYDDGPIAGKSDKVLAALNRTRAAATFFQMGQNLRNNASTGRSIVSAGMEVGNHTLTHPQLTKTARLDQEVRGQSELMRQTYGFAPMLMRPPYGARNAVVDRAAGKADQAVIVWDVDTDDWKTRSGPLTRTAALVGADHPGSIVLMHDIHDAAGQATEGIVNALRARDIHPVTVTELSLSDMAPRAGVPYCSATFIEPRGFECARKQLKAKPTGGTATAGDGSPSTGGTPSGPVGTPSGVRSNQHS